MTKTDKIALQIFDYTFLRLLRCFSDCLEQILLPEVAWKFSSRIFWGL